MEYSPHYLQQQNGEPPCMQMTRLFSLIPKKEDVGATKVILQAFGTFSGLHINLQKSSVHPIRDVKMLT
jgi:hypothetical protein